MCIVWGLSDRGVVTGGCVPKSRVARWASDGHSDEIVRETPSVVRTRSSREEGETRRGEACVCACACVCVRARARRVRARAVGEEARAVGEKARVETTGGVGSSAVARAKRGTRGGG